MRVTFIDVCCRNYAILRWNRRRLSSPLHCIFSGNQPAEDKPEGPYPVIVTQRSTGRRVPVVQAFAFGKYLGVLRVTFDARGEIIEWSGEPMLLDSSVDQGQQVQFWIRSLVFWWKLSAGETRTEFLEYKRRFNDATHESSLRAVCYELAIMSKVYRRLRLYMLSVTIFKLSVYTLLLSLPGIRLQFHVWWTSDFSKIQTNGKTAAVSNRIFCTVT